MIKRAYIMACQKDEYQSLAKRFRAIIFLATPHRGADMAQSLSRVLSLSPGARPYVRDLHRNSLATQSINDEFPQYAKHLQLFSFYETLPMTHGIGKGLIVEKDAAVLGYANETATYINANHREICKYASSDDPNYQVVRNALASIMATLREDLLKTEADGSEEQRRVLESHLGGTDATMDYFLDVNNMRVDGSCEWLLRKDTFRHWHDSTDSKLYWISAKPATGKTVLSGKAIQHLTSLDDDVMFYFFDYRIKSQTSISACLLSLAAQMARTHRNVLQTVLNVCQENGHLGEAEYRTIWRKLFVECLLRIEYPRPQYWVIDALDECSNHTELVPLLCKVIDSRSARILLTSRTRCDFYRRSLYTKAHILSEDIPLADTQSDIALYLVTNLLELPVIDEGARKEIVDVILAKSAGCFLWVDLILKELRQAHTSTEIRHVLEEVPSDMTDLYSRIMDQMSKAPSYGKRLAKSILTWTVCAARPLTTSELGHALEIDLNDKVHNIQASIESRCGQMVFIDSQSRVQMIHQTARDFLIDVDEGSEFAVDRSGGHGRILKTCLEYLNGNDMKGLRYRKASAAAPTKGLGPFARYACTSLYAHILQAPSQDDETLLRLAKFFESRNVLAWLEYLASTSDLAYVIRAAKALSNFLQRRLTYDSPIGRDTSLLESWATDLVRLVTKFGKKLMDSPSSIHHLIPPLCPSGTAIHKSFGMSDRGLCAVGLSSTAWDDCLAKISDPTEHFSAVGASDKFFAIGTYDGRIAVYVEATCQQAQILEHQESVSILVFGHGTEFLASGGRGLIRLWDVTSWQLVWASSIPYECMSIAIIGEERLLLAALRDDHLMIYNLDSGAVRDKIKWREDFEPFMGGQPVTAAFCRESYLLAIIYRGNDIMLWSLENYARYDIYDRYGSSSRSQRRGPNPGVLCLVFSLAPEANLLAAGWADGDLLLYDTSEGVVLQTAYVNAQALACSSDGRTLASGDSSGLIQLYDFETLRVLYRIPSEENCIMQLAFSGDSLHLVDRRRSECCVWDPLILLRLDEDDQSSDTMSVFSRKQDVGLQSTGNVNLIKALALDPVHGYFFCGKDDGSVCLYTTKTGRQLCTLYSHHRTMSIISLRFNYQFGILASLDFAGRIIVRQLKHCDNGWEPHSILMDHNAIGKDKQITINPEATRLMVHTASTDMLFSIPTDNDGPIFTQSWEDRCPSTWCTHPVDPSQVMLIMGYEVHLYTWQDLCRITGEQGILLQQSILPGVTVQSITPCFENSAIAIAFAGSSKPQSKSRLLLWSSSDFAANSESAAPIPQYHALADQVRAIIGFDGRRLVFLDNDGWVGSVEARATETDEYDRHFFIPADWLSINVALMTAVTPEGDIMFVKRDEIAIIKRGLDNVEPRFRESEEKPSGKRPSIIGKARSAQRPMEKLTLEKKPSWSPISD